MKSLSVLPSGCVVLLFLAIVGALHGQRPTRPVNVDTALTELPDFGIDDKIHDAPKESWKYASVQGIEVLSNFSDRDAREFLDEFFQYRTAMRTLLPVVGQLEDERSLSFILCKRKEDFLALNPMPESSQKAGPGPVRGLFLSDREQSTIVIGFLGGVKSSRNPYALVKINYLHSVLKRTVDYQKTSWLMSGLSRVMEHSKIQDGTITYDRFDATGPGEYQSFYGYFTGRRPTLELGKHAFSPDSRRYGVLETSGPRSLLPMERLIESRAEENPSEMVTWSMQAFAFVQMCLLKDGGKYQKGLTRFVRRLKQEPVTEELFIECFGSSYEQMGKELREYVDTTKQPVYRLKLGSEDRFPDTTKMVFRNATDAEVGRLKSDALRMGGFAEEARISLIAPYVRGERDPELLAALGLQELDVLPAERARKFLEKAYAGKTKRVLALVELARLRLADALKQPSAENAQLGADQMEKVLAPLSDARKNTPAMAELYELIALAWKNAEPRATIAQLAVLDEGVALFPGNTALLLAVIEAYMAHGFSEKAALTASLAEGDTHLKR